MNSFAAQLWQKQLFRKICRDLKIREREQIGILESQTEVVKDLQKRIVPDRFD